MKGLYHKRGDTFRLRIAAVQDDTEEAPIDLTGCAAAMAWCRDQTEALQLSTATGELAIDADPTTGVITATVSAATTAALALGTYHADLQIDWSDGARTSSETILIILVEDCT